MLKNDVEPKELVGVLRHFSKNPQYQEIQTLLIDVAFLIEKRLIGPEPIDVPDVAELLGETESWVREQVRRGTIPFHQAVEGGRVKFDRIEIQDWWESIQKGPKIRQRRH